MIIAVIGSGNVGGALAKKWATAGHTVILGVRSLNNFKGQALLSVPGISADTLPNAVAAAQVVLLAVPAPAAGSVAASLGTTEGKIIIDSMNVVMGRGPDGFSNTGDAILANTNAADVVKCFNSTGYNNMADPLYNGVAADMFMAGGSAQAKTVVRQLALDAGFAECYDIGGNEMFELLEKFAFFWINLAMFKGQGRDIAFKLMKR